MLVMYCVLRVSMLVMYLCVRGIDVGHEFVSGISMLPHVFVC